MEVFVKMCLLLAGFFLPLGHCYNILSKNFFENLQGHPMIARRSLSDASKSFIDGQITNFVHLLIGNELFPSKKKRSLLDTFTKNDKGIHLLTGITPSATVPVRFPEDIQIFQQNSRWFAAALESPNVKEHANYLVVFTYDNNIFTETARTRVVNGARLAVIDLEDSTLIAVAENDVPKSNFHNKSGIYQFDKDGLARIQSIDMHYASDVIFWKMHNEIFMAISQFTPNGNGNEVLIYKWLGKHFDLVQGIEANGAKKITHFNVNGASFLAVANFKDVAGNTRIYSEIYKYDYHVEKYEVYQRIVTRACTDIQVFTFCNGAKKDAFLVVANSFDKDSDGDLNYEIDSIVYKFIDGYFIPFQSIQVTAVQQWKPVEDSNNFVLFASSRFEGLKAFQYDGWSFVEVPQKLPQALTNAGIKSVRFAIFSNNSIVIANKNNNGKVPNVFRLEFKHEKPMNDIYDDLMQWCDHGLKRIDELSGGKVFDVVVGKPERADIEEEDDMDKEIEGRIDSLTQLLDEIDINTPEEISADEIIFNNVTFIHNLNTTSINGFNAEDLLENVLDIEEGFEIEDATIASIEVESLQNLKAINTHDISDLLHVGDDLFLDSFTVRGTLTAPEGINVKGGINGVSVTDQDLLLRQGDQYFPHPLVINEAKVEKLSMKELNGENLVRNFSDTTPSIIEYIANLTVVNLTIGGYINEVDIPTLHKYALQKEGDQEIFSFVFDTLHGKNLDVLGHISGRKISEMIPTDGGDYRIDQDIIFKNDVFIEDFHILDSFNSIKIKDGRLDVLLKNDSLEQEITGDKVFDEVIIQEAIWLQGHINSKDLEKMNPVVSINDNLFLEGDKSISGLVEVERFVKAKDVSTAEGTYSFEKLENEGLRLTAREVKPQLLFLQQLNVDEIFVDTINGKSPRSFVVTGSEEPQIIETVKTFLGDLKVTGATNALKINNVDVEDLETKVLKVEGDQIIVGKHHVRRVVADKIESDVTNFDKNITLDAPSWNENLTIFNSFKLDNVKAQTLTVRGLVNDFPFDDIVDDTVTKGTSRTIGGHKYFKNLTVNVLNVQNSIDIDQVPDKINELRLKGPLKIKNITIENLYFGEECNGVDKNSFDSFDVSENGSKVTGDQVFDKVIVYGNTYIASNKIGDVEIGDLVNNSVKVDEPHEFGFVNFESDVISKSPITLDGQIENFDFENVILSNQLESIIFDEKTFKENLTINGSTNFEAFINGVNISQFCMFAKGGIENKNLTVHGNAFFAKGPKVGNINDVNVQKIKKRGWFSDEDTILSGSADFGDVIFKNDIEVDSFLNNISLSFLHQNYFSKTKSQNVIAVFTFENDVIFENELTVPNITLNSGDVNGINLDEFVRTALLQDYDQVFETTVFFENCFVENLTGDFTVNDLDLEKDVMRYDKANMVTGTKIFQNLNVDSLKLDRNVRIQGVDVLEWFKNSVLKTTSFNVTGSKTFRNAFFRNGFQLSGKLNGQIFDLNNIMVRNTDQEITGTKTIHTEPLRPVVFKSIKLKGLLNGIDVYDLVNNQAYKNQENTFKTSLNLYNNLTTTNLIIEKTYQGINMSELISNVTNLGVLNNLLNEYKKLIDMSHKMKSSIENQAYFLHHYKIVQSLKSVTNSRKILCPDGATRLGILVNRDTETRMDLYEWHEEQEQFLRNATIHFANRPAYVDQVLMGRYLYTEGRDGKGHFTHMSNPLTNSISIFTNLTIQTASFVLPTTKEPCTLFIYTSSLPRIFCERQHQIELLQILSPLAYKASSITINDALYLIIITQPTNEIEPHTDIWWLNNNSYFSHHQSLFEAHPQSISTATYDGFHYLAIASGHVTTAMYSGRVEILRFDEDSLHFVPWQSHDLVAPTQVEFSVLPSQELVLFVITYSPTEPLLVYRYEGIAGFQLKITGSALPHVSYMNQFMGEAGQHFIVAQSYDETNVIQAIFKGEKVV